MFDKLAMKIAWLLPRKIAYWAAIRVAVNATQCKYSDQILPELLVTDAIKRW